VICPKLVIFTQPSRVSSPCSDPQNGRSQNPLNLPRALQLRAFMRNYSAAYSLDLCSARSQVVQERYGNSYSGKSITPCQA